MASATNEQTLHEHHQMDPLSMSSQSRDSLKCFSVPNSDVWFMSIFSRCTKKAFCGDAYDLIFVALVEALSVGVKIIQNDNFSYIVDQLVIDKLQKLFDISISHSEYPVRFWIKLQIITGWVKQLLLILFQHFIGFFEELFLLSIDGVDNDFWSFFALRQVEIYFTV